MSLITIQQFTLPCDNLADGAYTLRCWYNQGFLDSSGQAVAPGTSTTGTQLRSDATISGGFITFDPFTVYSTLDAEVPTPQSIQIACQLFRNNTSLPVFPFQQNGTPPFWIVPDDLGATISFEEWTIANQRIVLANPPLTFYPAAQVDALIEANNTQVAFNQDYAIGQYASLAAAITAVTVTGGTLVINEATTCPDDLTVPATITLRFTRKGSITMTSLKTLTVLGPIEADAVKVFFNAHGSGSAEGTVSLTGNTSLTEVQTAWWGLTGTSIQAAITAAQGICPITIAGGTTTCTSTLTITAYGTILRGQGAHAHTGAKATTLNFQNSTGDGLFVNGAYGCVIKDIYFEDATSLAGGGAAVHLESVTNAILENLHGTWYRGSTGVGIQLSDLITGNHACTITSVRDCTFGINGGTSFLEGLGCTSTNFTSCYAIGGSPGYHVQGKYSSLISCASDSGDGFAYLLDGAEGVTMVSCGAELMGQGFCQITNGGEGIGILSCYGSANNTTADPLIGSFVDITSSGVNFDIVIDNPRDSTPNAATTYSIYGHAGALFTQIRNNQASSLAKGVGGDALWLKSHVSQDNGGSILAGSIAVGTSGDDAIVSPFEARSTETTLTPMALFQNTVSGGHVIVQLDRTGNNRTAAVELSTANTATWYQGILFNAGTPNALWAIAPSNDITAAILKIATDGITSKGSVTLTPKTNDTWGAALTVDTTFSSHVIAASFTTSGTCTISPSGVGAAGTSLIITTEADASGSVVVTFSGALHSSGTQTTTASHFSTIEFLSDGTRYIERNRTTNIA